MGDEVWERKIGREVFLGSAGKLDDPGGTRSSASPRLSFAHPLSISHVTSLKSKGPPGCGGPENCRAALLQDRSKCHGSIDESFAICSLYSLCLTLSRHGYSQSCLLCCLTAAVEVSSLCLCLRHREAARHLVGQCSPPPRVFPWSPHPFVRRPAGQTGVLHWPALCPAKSAQGHATNAALTSCAVVLQCCCWATSTCPTMRILANL